MIKHLAITPPIIGRISIGRVIEKNGKRLPEKDDQFTITTQVQTPSGWMLHPLDNQLRQESTNGKLRSIPVTMLFNEPDLNFRAEYTAFDRKTGRVTCLCDGETCQLHTKGGIQRLPCEGAATCTNECKPYGRLTVRIADDTDIGCFMFRTTGYNSIRTLTARLRYYHAITDGHLATLPLTLKIRGKSTTQSYGTPIYYVDLSIRDGMTLEEGIQQAKQTATRLQEAGINQDRLDEVARHGFEADPFELADDDGQQVVDEFFPDDLTSFTAERPAHQESSQPIIPTGEESNPLLHKMSQRLAQSSKHPT